MKTHLDIKHSGTLGDDDRTEMTFSEKDVAHLMSILTDLYSDPAMAVIREYSTNAYDSHREAGTDRPIEVELPTALRQQLVIRDFGVGMSLDTIQNEFSKYGWSSKRDTDDQVGMLGLGCKSALSFTSQFTMVSVHEGLKITVLVTRSETGAGAVQIVDTVPTEEHNGVEIRVPGSYSDFSEEARRFFLFWDRGTVVVNGEEPDCIWDEHEDTLHLDPDVIATTRSEVVSDYGRIQNTIVMGNVPYPAEGINPEDHYDSRRAVIARVPIGTVRFTPSREELEYKGATNDTVAEVRAFVRAQAQRAISEEIAKAPNHTEALRIHSRLTDVHRIAGTGNTYKYQGLKMPISIDVPQPEKTLEFTLATLSWRADKSDRVSYLPASQIPKLTMIVTGNTNNGVPGKIKERIRKYCRMKKLNTGKVLVISSAEPLLPWAEDIPTVKMSTIKKVSLKEEPKAAKKSSYPFSAMGEHGGMAYPSKEVAENLVAWIEATGSEISDRGVAEHLDLGTYLARVPKRSVARFQREYSNVPHYRDWIGSLVAEKLSEWSRFTSLMDESASYSVDMTVLRRVARIKQDKIQDRELASLAAEFDSISTTSNDYHARRLFEQAERLGFEIKFPGPDKKLIHQIDQINNRYPMLLMVNRGGTGHEKHVITEYINNQYLLANGVHLLPQTY